MRDEVQYPRVLVFGQGFDPDWGGGITIINLFKGWPKDRIASVVTNYARVKANDICINVYGLERWRWPLSHFIKSKTIRPGSNYSLSKLNISKIKERNKSEKKLLLLMVKTIELTGLIPILHKEKLTKHFIQWVIDFNPDIIYTQIGDVKVAVMVYKLCKILKKPVAIHIMDDWIEAIYKQGVLSFMSRLRLNYYFAKLINSSPMVMGISEAMCIEYKKRYNKEFISFHNPVELSTWYDFQKKNWTYLGVFKIVYVGRIGIATKNGLNDIAKALDFLNKGSLKAQLKIVTPDFTESLKGYFESFEGVELCPQVPHSEIPSILENADLLFLPLDFDNKARKFSLFSMPTKATEYMASGTPTLIYAPAEIALTQHAKVNKWAYVVCERDTKQLLNAIIELMINEQLRFNLGSKAIYTANEKHNSKDIRNDFRMALLLGAKI